MTMREFNALNLEDLVELANKIGVSTDGVRSKAHLRAKLLNDARFTP